VTLVAGTRDRFLGAAGLRAEEERLASGGLRVRSFTFAGGHRLDDGTLRRIASPA
jgi:hypothetical protein